MAENNLQRKEPPEPGSSARPAAQKQNTNDDKNPNDNNKARKKGRTLDCLNNLMMLHKVQGALLGQMERELR